MPSVQNRLHWLAPLVTLASSVVALAVLMYYFSPSDGPGVVVGALLIVFCGTTALTGVAVQIFLSLTKRREVSAGQLFYVSVVCGTAGTFLLALQTLRQLQLIDVLLVVTLASIILFYIFRRF